MRGGDKFINVSNEEASGVMRRARARNHPERVCIECLRKNEQSYKGTPEWRHLKDRTGKVIKTNEAGEEVWLCNKHGLAQDRAINKAAQGALETRKRMSVDAILDKTSEEHERHIKQKMSVDSLLDQEKEKTP